MLGMFADSMDKTLFQALQQHEGYTYAVDDRKTYLSHSS